MSHQGNINVLEHIQETLTDEEIKDILTNIDATELSIIALYEKIKELKTKKEDSLDKLRKHLTTKHK